MRLSNKRKAPIYNFIHTLLWMMFGLGIAGFIVEKYKMGILGKESIIFILFPAALLFIFYLRGRQIFEYDSDGEALNFKNRNIIPFLQKAASDEFPKYKLKSYGFGNFFIYKRLYINITSKKTHIAVLKYDVSYLTNKEINDLKFSLNKVVKENNKEEANS